jgi:hypothetical protein
MCEAMGLIPSMGTEREESRKKDQYKKLQRQKKE